MAILFSAAMAVLVNISTFLIIGRTSAITYALSSVSNRSPFRYNMVGHGKLILILVSGYVFFDGRLSAGNLFGVLMTMAGIAAYSYLTVGRA